MHKKKNCNRRTALERLVEKIVSPVSILYKSIAGRYRPVRVADGAITARYRFIKDACWVCDLPWELFRFRSKAPTRMDGWMDGYFVYRRSTLKGHIASNKFYVI